MGIILRRKNLNYILAIDILRNSSKRFGCPGGGGGGVFFFGGGGGGCQTTPRLVQTRPSTFDKLPLPAESMSQLLSYSHARWGR